MYFTKLFNKWHYLLFAIGSLGILRETQAEPLSYNVDPSSEVGKIVRRYVIDTNKHRVTNIDYLELLQYSEETNYKYIAAQRVRDYIRILEHKEKNDVYNKKLKAKPDEYDKATEITKNTDYISLDTDKKKSVNSFNFQIFCIESTEEKCQNVRTNLNKIGESLSKQLVIKEPINIIVKTMSFCNRMGKDCGAIKTNAITTPSAFYSLYSKKKENSYLYPQALVKQLETDGTVDFLSYDMTIVINTDVDYWYWTDKKEIAKGQVDFQHVIAHEILHGLGFISGMNQTFKKDFTHIFKTISVRKEHPYLLPYFHYGHNGYFNAPIVKEILPPFIFDKFLAVHDPSYDLLSPISDYLSLLYEHSKKYVGNYVTLVIKNFEEDLDAYEGASFLYNYAMDSQWIFKTNNTISENSESIPIDTDIFNEWTDGLSASHIQCDSYYHTARNKKDGIMCAFIDEGKSIIERDSNLLNDQELAILSTLGWMIVNDKKEEVQEDKVSPEDEKEQINVMNENSNNDENTTNTNTNSQIEEIDENTTNTNTNSQIEEIDENSNEKVEGEEEIEEDEVNGLLKKRHLSPSQIKIIKNYFTGNHQN